MIRLIATDIDNTLVPEGSSELNPEYLDVIERLIEKEIQVAVVTGRHSASVRNMFAPLLDRIWIVSQNGSVIERGDNTEVLHPVPAAYTEELWNDLSTYNESVEQECASQGNMTDSTSADRNMPDDNATGQKIMRRKIDTAIETASTCYCPEEGSPMCLHLRSDFGFDIRATGSWNLIPDVLCSQILIWHPEDAPRFYKDAGIFSKWQGRMSVMPTGRNWINCVMDGNSKGNALLKLCDILGISPDETAAFGDNLSDISMIHAAGYGYAVENALPEVKTAANYVIPGYTENGVLTEMKKLLL